MDKPFVRQEGEEQLEHYTRAIVSFDNRYKSVLPSDVSPARFLDLAVSAITRKPKLLECTLPSICRSLYFCATLGLLPDSPMGHIFVVPFWNNKIGCLEAQDMIGYKGFAHLAYLSSLVGRIDAHAVRAKDFFDWEYGSSEFVRHKPYDGPDAGELTHAWAQVFFTQAHIPPRFLVMQKHTILEIKKNSPGAQYENTPWFNDRFEPEMWKKTPVRALAKLLPQSDGDKLAMAANYEEQMETNQETDPGYFDWPQEMQDEKPKERERATSRVKSGFQPKAEETTATVEDTAVGPTTLEILAFMEEHKSGLPPELFSQITKDRLKEYDENGRQSVFAEIQAILTKDKGDTGVEQPTAVSETGEDQEGEASE